ncbi:hypothetical protein BDR26DRAFT_869696 [Obelidium mucronatum]|nr:hypothetical protein BDR26DRAFT_869696 [Obelidium mucronatum]
MLVSYNNWIGEITFLDDKIAILFPSTNAICIPKDIEKVDPQDGVDDDSKFALARFYPGQYVQSVDASNLRNGVWLRGRFFDGCADEIGVCVGVKSITADVDWRVFNSLQNTMSSVQVEPPLETIDASLLTPVSSSFEHLSFQIGDFVCFKDEAFARQVLGLEESVTMETAPYMFAMRVVCTKTLVNVQWQDASITQHIPSTQLTPVLHPDDQDFWPTDYVTLLDSTDQDSPNGLYKDRIGMVMSCNAKERTVIVRWFNSGMDHLESLNIPHTEIQMHPDLQHRIRRSQSCTDCDGLVRVRFMESGNIASCPPNVLLVYKMEDEESDADDGSSGSYFTDDEEMQDENRVVADSDSDMESTASDASWETDGGNGRLMADSAEALGNTHIGTPAYVSMLTEEELEWVNFKSCERLPEGHRYYASGQLTYPHCIPSKDKKGGMFCIRRGYSMLSKSLPQGILVRVFEDRIDPHANGKVCLSLLGTWTTSHPSESWNPTKSNLLQLFISLQSLVLTRNPYFNEPGHMYNERVYLIVLKSVEHVMKELLEGFEGEIGYHFFRLGWLRKMLERGNEIVARSLLGAGDGVGEGGGGRIGSSEEIGDRDGFPILSVSSGCLKLLKMRLESLAKFETEKMAA